MIKEIITMLTDTGQSGNFTLAEGDFYHSQHLESLRVGKENTK